jgi:hypothetical protein
MEAHTVCIWAGSARKGAVIRVCSESPHKSIYVCLETVSVGTITENESMNPSL